MLEKITAARIAMAFDCEGTITIARDRNPNGHFRYRSFLRCANTDKRLPLFLQRHIGGSIYRKPARKANHKLAWDWYFLGGNERTEQVLLDILPYLIMKDEQAKALLEFIRLGHNEKTPEQREIIFQKMRILNRRGEPATTNTPCTEPSVKIESDLTGDSKSVSEVIPITKTKFA